MHGRRDVLKLGLAIAAGGAVAPLLAACAAPSGTNRRPPRPAAGAAPALSGPDHASWRGGDPSAEPALKKVYDDFKAQNPGIEWDIRALPGGGPDGIGSRAPRWRPASRWGS